MLSNQSRQAAFIATLGTEPQVVTVALDLLIAQGWTFEDVVVIHTAGDSPLIKKAMDDIKGEFARGFYAAGVKAAEPAFVELRLDEEHLIYDIYTEEEAGVVFRVIYEQVRRHKELHRVVHLNAAGGRKGMTMFGMSAAQLLFDDSDSLWLLSSSNEFIKSRGLHCVKPKDAQLISVPVLRWSLISASVRLVVDDPFEAVQRQRDLLDFEYRERCKRFLDQLTERERQIVETFVCDPSLSNAEIGDRLSLASKPVANYFTVIFDKAYSFYGLREEAKGKREVLVGLLAPYYAWLNRQKHS